MTGPEMTARRLPNTGLNSDKKRTARNMRINRPTRTALIILPTEALAPKCDIVYIIDMTMSILVMGGRRLSILWVHCNMVKQRSINTRWPHMDLICSECLEEKLRGIGSWGSVSPWGIRPTGKSCSMLALCVCVCRVHAKLYAGHPKGGACTGHVSGLAPVESRAVSRPDQPVTRPWPREASGLCSGGVPTGVPPVDRCPGRGPAGVPARVQRGPRNGIQAGVSAGVPAMAPLVSLLVPRHGRARWCSGNLSAYVSNPVAVALKAQHVSLCTGARLMVRRCALSIPCSTVVTVQSFPPSLPTSLSTKGWS